MGFAAEREDKSHYRCAGKGDGRKACAGQEAKREDGGGGNRTGRIGATVLTHLADISSSDDYSCDQHERAARKVEASAGEQAGNSGAQAQKAERAYTRYAAALRRGPKLPAAFDAN